MPGKSTAYTVYVGDLRDDQLEVVELGAYRVHQEQGWPAADAQVADASAAAQRDVADLPALAPRLRVLVLRVVDVAGPVDVAEFVRRGHDIAPWFKDRSRAGCAVRWTVAATQEAMLSGAIGRTSARPEPQRSPVHRWCLVSGCDDAIISS
jgi:hypothetical protein